ncbi:MAG: nicotinate (nicotinamide) nucleotide adenylyltransferase [Chloroflexota bacterium]
MGLSLDGRPAGVRRGFVGVMGGSFDPIHLGHLAVAEEARDALGLEKILFVPAGLPPHKPGGTIASADDRVAMTQLAIAGNPAFAVSRIDVDRAGPSYTNDTIALLAAEASDDQASADPSARRAASGSVDLTLIMSAETLAGLPGWHEPRQLLAACRIAVVPREGYPVPDPTSLARQFPGLEDRFDLLAGPRLGISSTAIRERVAAGRSIRYLVPDAVERYIVDHHLYVRAESSADDHAREHRP